MSKNGHLLFAVISFVVCGTIAGYAIAYFVQEFGGALNPSCLFRGSFPLAFAGAVASLGAIVLPISSILLMRRGKE